MLQEMGKRFEVRIGMQALYKRALLIFRNGSDFCKALLGWNWKLAAAPNLHLTSSRIISHHLTLFISVQKMSVMRQYSSPTVDESLKDLAESGVDNVGEPFAEIVC